MQPALVTAISCSFAAPAARIGLPQPAPLRHAPIRSTAALSRPTAVGLDGWVNDLDWKGFQQEVRALGKELEDNQGAEDVRHLRKMMAWSNACGAIGLATMWMSSPLGRLASVIGLSTWTCTRWTMIGHHICHGGYNRQDVPHAGGKGLITKQGFAVGSVYRRCRDWFDWMLPEAWNVEHNDLHHFRLSESGDPDLVERNLEVMREFPLWRPLKYAGVAGLAAMWKWYYYAPNTYKQLKVSQMRKEGKVVSAEDAHAPFTLMHALGLAERGEAAKYDTSPLDFMRRVMGPYLLLRFLALPAPLLALGNPAFYWAAVTNLALSDALSNIHSFIIIATNHCGDDMYKFENSVTPRSSSFYMRAITSSANFRTANGIRKDGTARKVHGLTADLNDFFHGWLNYQIEHHCWPQLSMLSYQKAAPRLRSICDKYGVPYVQQNVFKRLKKTADIMVGKTSMRPFDEAWENAPDAFQWADQKADKQLKEAYATMES